MKKEDAKVINIGASSPINISLVDNTPIPVVVDVIKNEPQPIEVYSNTSIISGAANLYELGDVASDGHQVLDSGDKKVLMLNADNKHPGKWMAGKVNLSEYAKKTELDEISNNIENTNKDLSGVKEDLLEKEAFLDEKIAEIKGNLEKTKDELIVTKKELVDAKNELSDARQRLEEQGVTVEMVVGQVNEQEQKITTAITNIESESDRVNILRSEMDGINLTITNEILSQLNEDGSDITLKIGQKIDARAETIETAVKKLREGTDETMVSWIGQKIDGRAETIETAIKKLQTGEDAELVSWVGQKIDGRAETIETAVARLREGTDETMVSWVGQKIDAKAETITTAVIESLEQEGFATKEFVGQEIDGAKKSVTTGIMTFITEQDFSTKSFVGQEIDGAEGRITTAYEKYVEDKGYATTTFVGQEIDGVNKTITTAVAESKESIVGEDGVINSRIQAAYTSWDIAGIKNSVVDQNGDYIKSSEINQKADRILITVQENDEGYKGRFSSIEANLDGVSTIIANGDNYAAIIARVNEDSSSVTIEAKKINLLGETVARELSAIKATINELTLTNAHVSGVVECVINDTVYWQLLNDGSGNLAKGNIKWNPDGSGSLASGNINWDINGNAVFNGSIESGSGKIAGWTISTDCISSNREGANTKLFSNGHLVNEETDENGKLWKHWEFNYDGSGSIANNSLSWDPYGYIKLGDDVILGANELRVAQLISNVSLLLSMFELDENGDIKTKDYYADGAWHSRGLYSPSFVSSAGFSDTQGTGGGTVVGATVGGKEVTLSGGILEFDAYPTTTSLGLKSLAFKDSLSVSEVVGLQSALNNKQDVLGYTPVNKAGDTINGTLTIVPNNISSYQDGLVLHDSGGGAGEGIRIRWTSGSYTQGVTLGVNSDLTQLIINDTYTIYHSGNLTASVIAGLGTLSNNISGNAAYATSAGSAPASDVYAWAKESTKPSYSFSEITSKPTTISGYGITDALKIDGSNGAAEGVSALINKLNEGFSDPGDTDYYVCQYAGGGTTHTSYYRRPMSAMWNWIKAKTDTLYPSKTGTGASGTWGINISGNAATATKLQTPRTIWGQSFDGTGNVSGALTGVTDITASGKATIAGVVGCSNLMLPFGGKVYNGGNYGLYVSGAAGDYGSAIYLTHDHGQNQTAFRIHSHFDDGIGGLSIDFSTTAQNYGASPIDSTYANIIHIRGNGNVGIGTTSPSAKLHVIGNILATGAVTAGQASDARLKSNIVTALNACGILRSLRGVEFDWNTIATENCKDLKGHDVGLIAQEVESLIPSAIGTIWGEYKRLDYAKITPYLVEGWKAHDDEIQRLKAEIIELKKKIYGLEKQ